MKTTKQKQGAWLLTELVVAMGILAVCLMPLAYSFLSSAKLCRAYYLRAVAMEIVAGETEILAAGEHRRYKPGVHPYEVGAEAARNLPGHFVLTVEKCRI